MLDKKCTFLLVSSKLILGSLKVQKVTLMLSVSFQTLLKHQSKFSRRKMEQMLTLQRNRGNHHRTQKAA